ncbi:class I SAM-dependent methyltransferase [Sulfuritalea sp.]|uniref:class I SAM-dependent methyltransferase n=1 Tax=Sulfuritalea sp. TaxID=2480090 RepID=UPI001AC1B93D|nr:class I SAM-dependent methyltransferase [Sulfuritalea sp.]MBN8474137.1 class I SAM-dependent methyltransferase [Sulfuritalea sp.]
MTHSLRWQSEAGVTSPRRIVVADDRMTADAAWRLACEGTALLWRGDFQNARQLLQAMARRIERKPPKQAAANSASASFHQYRLAQAQRARTLGMLLLPFDDGYRIPLRRAPDVNDACVEAYGPASGPFAASLRELLGVIGAHEWRKKGVPIGALGARMHPHYGVFSPVRGEYVALVAQAPLPPNCERAFDIGTGTGVLAAVLARRGVARVVATDNDARAIACAADNIRRLGLSGQVEVVAADLFPPEQAQVVVCNPPWLPGRAGTTLERAVYDPDSRMMQGFLAGLAARLAPGGEGWLILSDLAEHLGLRSRDDLLAAFAKAGLAVVGRLDAAPIHSRASDRSDPLHAARAREITSLWRLRPISTA